MYVDIALHVVHSLIEVKTYMFLVSCSAFIVDISEIEEVGVFLNVKFESILCIRIFGNARICSYKAGKSV